MPAEPQLYMWNGLKEIVLTRHDFFVEQIKARVLGNFENIEAEADQKAEEVYEHLGSIPSWGEDDMSAAAETAFEAGYELYELLTDMRTQTMLGAVASLYHQWDKEFRHFLEHELCHTYDRDEVTKFCWRSPIGPLFDLLADFGWDVKQEAFYPQLDACRLIVNVYKHGKGGSLDDLAANYPQYLKTSTQGLAGIAFLNVTDFKDLGVTLEEFDELANAIRSFWVNMPERLSLVTSTE